MDITHIDFPDDNSETIKQIRDAVDVSRRLAIRDEERDESSKDLSVYRVRTEHEKQVLQKRLEELHDNLQDKIMQGLISQASADEIMTKRRDFDEVWNEEVLGITDPVTNQYIKKDGLFHWQTRYMGNFSFHNPKSSIILVD